MSPSDPAPHIDLQPIRDYLVGLNSSNWSAIAAWIAVIAAIATIKFASKYAKEQVEQAKLAREEQAQPNVVLFAEHNEHNWHVLEIVIKNFGATPAYDLKVTFAEEVTVSPEFGSDEPGQIRFPDCIPILAPEQEWRTMWDASPRRSETIGLDGRFEGKVEYRDSNHKHFETNSILDWSTMKHATQLNVRTTHDIHRVLKEEMPKLTKSITIMNRHLSSLGDEHSGVWVYIGDTADERSFRADQQAIHEERSRRNIEYLDSLRPQANQTSDRTEEQPEPAPPNLEPSPEPGHGDRRERAQE